MELNTRPRKCLEYQTPFDLFTDPGRKGKRNTRACLVLTLVLGPTLGGTLFLDAFD